MKNSRFKFRAWNKKKKKWEEDPAGIALDIETGIPWWTELGEMMTEAKDVILMQCTGIVDRNGREIYEGDIVKVPIELIEEIGASPVEFIEAIAQVVYKPGSFYIDLSSRMLEINSSCEVIGNIYDGIKEENDGTA